MQKLVLLLMILITRCTGSDPVAINLEYEGTTQKYFFSPRAQVGLLKTTLYGIFGIPSKDQDLYCIVTFGNYRRKCGILLHNRAAIGDVVAKYTTDFVLKKKKNTMQ